MGRNEERKRNLDKQLYLVNKCCIDTWDEKTPVRVLYFNHSSLSQDVEDYISTELLTIQRLNRMTRRYPTHMCLECQKCEDNFCCLSLGQRICSEHCNGRDSFCVSCPLYNIEEQSPAEI